MNFGKACCFFGHRKVNQTPELIERVTKEIEVLITEKQVSTFYFGSKSEFDDLCHKICTNFKEKYPHIKRVYVRAEFPHIPECYADRLLKYYEDTYFPEHMENAGRASYVERNQEMINKSDFCIAYYDESYEPPLKNSKQNVRSHRAKSGTKEALNYAIKKGIYVKNVFTDI